MLVISTLIRYYIHLVMVRLLVVLLTRIIRVVIVVSTLRYIHSSEANRVGIVGCIWCLVLVLIVLVLVLIFVIVSIVVRVIMMIIVVVVIIAMGRVVVVIMGAPMVIVIIIRRERIVIIRWQMRATIVIFVGVVVKGARIMIIMGWHVMSHIVGVLVIIVRSLVFVVRAFVVVHMPIPVRRIRVRIWGVGVGERVAWGTGGTSGASGTRRASGRWSGRGLRLRSRRRGSGRRTIWRTLQGEVRRGMIWVWARRRFGMVSGHVRVGVILSDVHGTFDQSVFDGGGGTKGSEVNQGEQKI
jgi:hypothetical protein